MTEVLDIKAAARSTWAAGEYDAIADRIWEMGGRLARQTALGPGVRVLDVACGTGNATLPAAEAGAEVVGVDLTPELLEAGRRRAREAGLAIEWVEGDAEELPFEDGSFDAVLSTVGVMFAQRHEAAAAELARVLGPGGRLGLCNWTPEGEIGELFKAVATHAPPPQGTVPPVKWGVEGHVRGLFEGTEVELEFARERVRLRFDSVEQGVEAFATKYGPMVKARERLEAEGSWPALRDDVAGLFARHNEASDGSLVYPAEYLVVTGRRAG